MSVTMTTRTLPLEQRRSSDSMSEAIISSEVVDREGDVLLQQGGDWSGWQRTGAPLLWAHDHRSLPVAKAEELWISGGKTHVRFRWVQDDSFAQRVANVYRQGLLAMSVGFKPVKSSPLPNGRGIRFERWIGLEASFVPVPANDAATAVSRSLGLPVDDVVLEVSDWREPTAYDGGQAELRAMIRRVARPLIAREFRAAAAEGATRAVLTARGRVD